MSDIITRVDTYGRLYLRSEVDGVVHRQLIEPGRWNGGVWADTDVSQFTKIVQDAAAEHWTPETIAALKSAFPWEPEPLPSTDPVDYPLTARQIRLGLVRNGVSLATIQATIDALPSPQRDEAQIYWEFSTMIHWEHPMTQALMALAGIDAKNAAAMWMAAKDYEK